MTSLIIHSSHSGYFYSASSSPLLLRGDPDCSRRSRRSTEFHAEAPHATCSSSYVAAREGVELSGVKSNVFNALNIQGNRR